MRLDKGLLQPVGNLNVGGALTVTGATTLTGQLTANGSCNFNATIRIDAETVKTADYTVTASDVFVIMNGTNLTATLPAGPTADHVVFIRNLDAATAVTVGRNGQTIDGAAANASIAASTGALFTFNGTGWYRLI